ncbi:hypothetical protein YK48G_07890 [Lentilactobacillus fungorum]|uniref:Uncharacterized protein n=1 Tax=Lentilactobacillus fungorum TaxID=2201250 RepID=A0ABQ3VYE9_9LACO|nr:hypothetical protein [Lentilactobacillus fungorum]GHP13364.1 hypothetical protein YK48G_07890 [Lentilactobacillus fungorum]
MLLIWLKDNYWRIAGLLLVLGVVLFVAGLALGGFNFNMFNYPGNIDYRPWYWFLGF